LLSDGLAIGRGRLRVGSVSRLRNPLEAEPVREPDVLVGSRLGLLTLAEELATFLRRAGR
jgi:hypothetical protein